MLSLPASVSKTSESIIRRMVNIIKNASMASIGFGRTRPLSCCSHNRWPLNPIRCTSNPMPPISNTDDQATLMMLTILNACVSWPFTKVSRQSILHTSPSQNLQNVELELSTLIRANEKPYTLSKVRLKRKEEERSKRAGENNKKNKKKWVVGWAFPAL